MYILELGLRVVGSTKARYRDRYCGNPVSLPLGYSCIFLHETVYSLHVSENWLYNSTRNKIWIGFVLYTSYSFQHWKVVSHNILHPNLRSFESARYAYMEWDPLSSLKTLLSLSLFLCKQTLLLQTRTCHPQDIH